MRKEIRVPGEKLWSHNEIHWNPTYRWRMYRRRHDWWPLCKTDSPFFSFPMLWMSFHFHVAFQNPSTIHVSTINVFWKHLSSKTHLTTSPKGSRWFACPQTQHNSKWWKCSSASRRCNYGRRYLCQKWSKNAWIPMFMFLLLTGPPKCPYIQENDSCTRV